MLWPGAESAKCDCKVHLQGLTWPCCLQVDVTAPSAEQKPGTVPEQMPDTPDNQAEVDQLKQAALGRGQANSKDPWAGLSTGTTRRKPHTTVSLIT